MVRTQINSKYYIQQNKDTISFIPYGTPEHIKKYLEFITFDKKEVNQLIKALLEATKDFNEWHEN